MNQENISLISKFIDITTKDDKYDKKAGLMLDRLKSKLFSSLENIKSYETTWTKAMETTLQVTYLDQFCKGFVEQIEALIDRNLEVDRYRFLSPEKRKLFEEVLHHSQLAENKSKLFCGQEETIDKIKDYITNPDIVKRSACVITGPSGCGKTAILAKVATLIGDWMKDSNPVIIIRFFGTSPDSSDIMSSMKTLIRQICFVFDKPEPSMDINQMVELHRILWNLLKTVSQDHPETPLILLLDSTDQLSQRHRAHRLAWLPRELPKNIYFILSMISDRFECLSNAHKRIRNKNMIIEIPPFSGKSVDELISSCLKDNNRTLNPNQLSVLRCTVEKCETPLFIKILLDRAIGWQSYTAVTMEELPTCVASAITYLFENIENKYGIVFVTHALGYLTCARGGLTCVEMDDVLSCDDEVLNEVYKYHDPPLEGSIRIPSLMWVRLKEHLREYFADQQIDDKNVTTWYHRQFFETAELRYLHDPKVLSAFHMQLAEIYDQENGIKRTIVLKQRGGKVIRDADRKVQLQPMSPTNLRKLKCLMHHFFNSGDIELLKLKCLLNFSWLLNCMQAYGVGNLLSNFKCIAESSLVCHHSAVEMVGDLLQVCYASLNYDIGLFPYHVMEHLKPHLADHSLKQLYTKTEKFLLTHNKPQMLPTHSMNFPSLESPLKFTMMLGSQGYLSSCKTIILCSQIEQSTHSCKIQVFNLSTFEIQATINLAKATPFMFLKSEFHFAVVDDSALKFYETETGDLFYERKCCPDDAENVVPRCITTSELGFLIAVGLRFMRTLGRNLRTCSNITLFDFTTGHTNVRDIDIPGKKGVDHLAFACNDEKLVATARDKFVVLNVSDLTILHQMNDISTLFGAATFLLHTDQSTAFVASSFKSGVKVMEFDLSNHNYRWSPMAKVESASEDSLTPFAIAIKPDASMLLIGTGIKDKKIRNGQLWLWHRLENPEELVEITIGDGCYKAPTAFLVLDTWLHVIIGWNNGEISMCDLENRVETIAFLAHGHSINTMQLFCHGENMVTLSDDNCLKVWRIQRLFKKQQTDKALEPEECRAINQEEQCIDAVIWAQHMVTASHINENGPKFWHLKNGQIDEKLTTQSDTLYKESLVNNDITFHSHCHAQLLCFGNKLFYLRKLRSSITLCVMNCSSKSIEILAHKHFSNTFLSLHFVDRNAAVNTFLVLDGILEALDENLTCQCAIDIPKIIDEIHNMGNSAGKNKLLHYKVGMTADWKYLIIVNPTPTGGKSGRYFDIIDLDKKLYVTRILMSADIPWTIMEDGLYYLILDEDDIYNLVKGKKMNIMPTSWKYSCPIQCNKQMLSVDEKLAVQVDKRNHEIEVWSTSPIEMICCLKGHLMEVTCFSFAVGKGLLISGSLDNTVRLWLLPSGQQLALFHTYGAVENVHFDDTSTYVVVHCSSAPEQKRAIVLRISNIENKLVEACRSLKMNQFNGFVGWNKMLKKL